MLKLEASIFTDICVSLIIYSIFGKYGFILPLIEAKWRIITFVQVIKTLSLK